MNFYNLRTGLGISSPVHKVPHLPLQPFEITRLHILQHKCHLPFVHSQRDLRTCLLLPSIPPRLGSPQVQINFPSGNRILSGPTIQAILTLPSFRYKSIKAISLVESEHTFILDNKWNKSALICQKTLLSVTPVTFTDTSYTSEHAIGWILYLTNISIFSFNNWIL